MKKILFLLLILFSLVLIGLSSYLYFFKIKPDATSYDECIKLKGSQKLFTQPPACTTPHGLSFTQKLPPAAPPVAPQDEPVKVDSISALFDSKDNPNKEKQVSGILVKGNEIDRAYCPSGIYLKDDSGKIQLRTRGISGNLMFYSDDTNLGKRVEIVGKYPDADVMCEALTCDCEDYMVVEQITLMEIPGQ